MEKNFKLQLVTPSKSEVLQNTRSFTAESENGVFTSLANHEQYIIKLNPCILSIKNCNNSVEKFFINGATAKIMQDIQFIITEELYKAEEIDKNFLEGYYDKKIAIKIAKELKIEL